MGFRRLFASGQIPISKIFGGYLQVATLKSSCIVLFAPTLKTHPVELLEVPFCHQPLLGDFELRDRAFRAVGHFLVDGRALGDPVDRQMEIPDDPVGQQFAVRRQDPRLHGEQPRPVLDQFARLVKIPPFELIEIHLKDTIPAQLKRYCIYKK